MLARSVIRSRFLQSSRVNNSVRLGNTLDRSIIRTYCTKDETSVKEGDDYSAVFDSKQAMVAIFTCNPCKNRHSYQFSKFSYNKGVVVVRCPSCRNLHLVADNLGWFSDTTRNLETIAKEKGINHKVLKGSLSESLENLGFTAQDAELISRKRSARIKLSEEVIQAVPEFENTDSELKKE